MKAEGPEITVTRSCHACIHCASAEYRRQGDSGWDVSCKLAVRRIGTTWVTPDWCPVDERKAAASAEGAPIVLTLGSATPERMASIRKFLRVVEVDNRDEVEEMQRRLDMACETPPHDCDCAGCRLARATNGTGIEVER